MHLSKTREDRISNSYPQRDNNSCRNMTLFYDIGQLQRLERLDVIEPSVPLNSPNGMRREKMRRFMRKKLSDYGEHFTVHGLTKTFSGHTTSVEKIFWLTFVVMGILVCLFVLHALVSKYMRFAVYTEIRFEITNKHYYPSITFCEESLLLNAYFSYCGVPPRSAHPNPNERCRERPKFKPAEIQMSDSYWSNGYFNVTMCSKYEFSDCYTNLHFKSRLSVNNSCITWNHQGHIHDERNEPYIKFHFNKPPQFGNLTPHIVAIPHHPNLTEIDFTAKIDLDPLETYVIKLDKTIIKRLPAPYPSNCTHEKGGDIFPGIYSRHGCIEASNRIEMYKQCGDMIDYVLPYIPEPIKREYGRNMTIREALNCITNFSDRDAKKSFDCNFPCYDMDLHIVSTTQDDMEHDDGMEGENHYHLALQYQNIDTYKVMEEKPLYRLDQLACEMGGIIGVLIGMSTMSVVEIIVYAGLRIVNRYI